MPWHWELGGAVAVFVSMNQQPINDPAYWPAYWRERAREARRVAEQLDDVVAQQTMLEIANSYDSLAVITKEEVTIDQSRDERHQS